eukprot:674435-Prymnesium_polylepis.2
MSSGKVTGCCGSASRADLQCTEKLGCFGRSRCGAATGLPSGPCRSLRALVLALDSPCGEQRN